MSKVVSLNSYKLQEGASVQDFLAAMDTLINDFISKQKGVVSSTLFREGEIWTDYIEFETKEDLMNFITLCNQNDLARKCYSFMDFDTLKSHILTVEKSYKW